MENKDLIESWLRRHIEKERKEAEEEKLKKENPVKEPKKSKKPKIILPQVPNFTQAQFLEGEFGKQINDKIQAKYRGIEAINQVVYDDNGKIITGSTPFYVVAVQEFLPENLRVATQTDLEKIIKTNAPNLSRIYEDSALVLRTKQNPNQYLAEDLFDQFKSKGINLKEDSAYVIPLYTLKLRKDNNSPNKLSFKVTDSTINNYFEAPILNSESGSYINPSEINENTGLPNKVYKKQVSGNRQLWTGNSGLVRLCLCSSLDIGSGGESLSYGDRNSRVVLVSA